MNTTLCVQSHIWLKGLTICLCASKVISSLVMSLLNVPSTPFPSFFSSPTASPTPLTGIRLDPCAAPLWSGPSGHLADPMTNIDYESKFCIDISIEHTPINLPSSSRNFPHDYEATPRHSGGSSSSQHTAASRVPTLLKLGSLGTSLPKVSADYDSVASGTSIKETCADMDRETVVSSLFGYVSKEKSTRLCSASDCLGFVRSRNRLKQWTDKLCTIEDVCKTLY